MESKFSVEEKKRYMFSKHIQNHLLEYIMDIIGPLIFTMILLYICKAEEFILGIILSIAFSIGKITYNIIHYKKEYIDVDIK